MSCACLLRLPHRALFGQTDDLDFCEAQAVNRASWSFTIHQGIKKLKEHKLTIRELKRVVRKS